MLEFYRLARAVSAKTYQEKLLNAGLPESIEFQLLMNRLASEDNVRAFILFDGEQPVSYLYCPVHDGVLIYQFLGYDPEYLKLSVGTVLQWLALESLFAEDKFRLFDFTEGESDHKRLFATHSVRCANVFFLRSTLSNAMLLRCHLAMDQFSAWIGKKLDQYGLKAKVKKLIRFAR
jgi:CelD/BcsL family acetyltransferase involved in cellulose biosynthesis